MKIEFLKLLPAIESYAASGEAVTSILYKICQLLKEEVYHYDWVGFYVSDTSGSNLLLATYAGKPTDHTVIPFGKGVCGQVAENKKLKIVQDVSQEQNYIACSLDVQSEIVVPILKNGKFVAQIDIDSHSPAPFTIDDEEFLTLICQKLSILF